MKLLMLITVLSYSHGCPLWFVYNDTANECQCGESLKIVNCDPKTRKLTMENCYCMTYNNNTDQTVVGFCLFTCDGDLYSKTQIFTQYKERITEEMCGHVNRTGQLCGECLEGNGLPVYSYSLHCVGCHETEFKLNLFKYILVAFLPLTLFYLFVTVVKVSITSGNMVGYILICQLANLPTLLRMYYHNNSDSTILHIAIAGISLWNLDFFRSLYPPFCIHPKMSTLHVLSLDYLIGVYPLFLILLTYIAVTLHDRYPIVVKIWRPAYRVLRCIRREWNIRGSLIQAFATFLILSYVKIINVSFDLLLPVYLQTPEGETLNQSYLLNNPEIEYFGKQHRPYGVLAIVMLTVFNILPMVLLFLYPCCCFQKCLGYAGARSIPLRTFMDAFQGCYRHKKRDCRYFAAFYLLVRIMYSLAFLLLRFNNYFKLGIYSLAFTIMATVLLFVKPYQKEANNKTDIFFFLLAAIGFSSIFLASHAKTPVASKFILNAASTPTMIVLLIYGYITITKHLLPKKLLTFAKECYQHLHSRTRWTEEMTESFQYRYKEERSPLLTK